MTDQERKFWQAVYVAAIRDGRSVGEAELVARAAIEARRRTFG